MLTAQRSEFDRRVHWRVRQHGQATVELVLSMGLLLILLLAALDFGRAFFSYIALVNAAREGARSGVMSFDPSTIAPAVQQEIQGNNLDTSRLTTSYIWGGSGRPVTVTVSYRFNLITTSFLPFSQVDLTTSAVMSLP
jgi:Flp pilus assembly protein TadG